MLGIDGGGWSEILDSLTARSHIMLTLECPTDLGKHLGGKGIPGAITLQNENLSDRGELPPSELLAREFSEPHRP